MPPPTLNSEEPVIGYVPRSFSQVVPDHSSDEAADDTANDCADGGKGPRDTRCSLVIVHQNPFPFACFSYAS